MLAFAATVKQVLSTATTPTVLASIPLVTFDGEKATTHEFVELNDPVMGGRSSGTWRVPLPSPRCVSRPVANPQSNTQSRTHICAHAGTRPDTLST